MSQEKEIIHAADGSNIEIDPKFLIESVDDATKLLDAHTKILVATRSIIKRGIASGLKPDEAAAIAMELSRRAGQKAGKYVHMDSDKEERK